MNDANFNLMVSSYEYINERYGPDVENITDVSDEQLVAIRKELIEILSDITDARIVLERWKGVDNS